uniref:Uncharacterized protein n=1 Tax=Populus trichocarpa TaxID=3694 RepID=B9ND12_POPTR
MLWDRSFSFSINKGEPIFIWSVLDLQVFDRNLDVRILSTLRVVLNIEVKVHLQISPHKESCERWKHGSANFQN